MSAPNFTSKKRKREINSELGFEISQSKAGKIGPLLGGQTLIHPWWKVLRPFQSVFQLFKFPPQQLSNVIRINGPKLGRIQAKVLWTIDCSWPAKQQMWSSCPMTTRARKRLTQVVGQLLMEIFH